VLTANLVINFGLSQAEQKVIFPSISDMACFRAESKKGKEPRNQVPRKVWKSEEGFGLIPRLNEATCHFKVAFTI
jgi:hypothetical protein